MSWTLSWPILWSVLVSVWEAQWRTICRIGRGRRKVSDMRRRSYHGNRGEAPPEKPRGVVDEKLDQEFFIDLNGLLK